MIEGRMEVAEMSSEICPELPQHKDGFHLKSSCILFPVPWKIFCSRRPCSNSEDEWVDYYGFSVAGGYENGQLLYVRSTDWCMRSRDERKPKTNDVLLEANGYKLAGACTDLIYAVMKKLWEESIALQLVVLPGVNLGDHFDLSQFLQDNAFPAGSIKDNLQLEIRRSIYRQYPPVTSRPPSDEERGKVYPNNRYFFWTEKRLAEDLDKHRFLERGEYKGHFYGTVVPILSRNLPRKFEEATDWLDNPNPTRRMSFKKAVGMLPVDYNKETVENDLTTYAPVLGS